jgi:hypothetical protein
MTIDRQCLVIDADSQVSAFDELVNRQQRVIRLHDSLGNLRGKSTPVEDKGERRRVTFGDGKIEKVATIRSGYSWTLAYYSMFQFEWN